MKNELKTKLKDYKEKAYNISFRILTFFTFISSIACFGLINDFIEKLYPSYSFSSDVSFSVYYIIGWCLLFIFILPFIMDFILMIDVFTDFIVDILKKERTNNDRN